MNRKKMLKEMKKNKKLNKEVTDENYINRFIGTIFGIIIVLITGYLLVGIFVTKSINFKNNETEEKTEATIDNTTILAGNILNQKSSSYYVLIYDVNEKNSVLKSWITYYKNKDESKELYVVDSKDKLNSKFIVSENSNKNPASVDDLKIISPTLIKIENGTVTEYIEGTEEIKSILKE